MTRAPAAASQPASSSRPHQNASRGIAFMIGTMLVFSTQDGVSRLLAEHYPPIFIVMIRYWAFALFVIAFAAAQPGGLATTVRTKHPLAQVFRGLLLAAQISLLTYSFAKLGLGETHAIMAINPLLIAAAGALLLGERVILAQWLAVAVGFVGVVILVTPTSGVFDWLALIPFACAIMFAVYGILTRWVGKDDLPATSFFYTGMGGAVGMSLIGPFYWTEMTGPHWAWMGLLCLLGMSGHYLLIKAYEATEAATLQPFAYLQLALTSVIGVLIFSETIDAPFLIGSGLIVAAGLFALKATPRSK
ncbi:MAG: DMT family transporter [Pseudomonadota bacterium]